LAYAAVARSATMITAIEESFDGMHLDDSLTTW